MTEPLLLASLLGATRHTRATMLFCLTLLAALAWLIKLTRTSSALDQDPGDLENAAILYCPQCGLQDPGVICQTCGFQTTTH